MAEIDQLYKRAEEAFQKRSYDYARDLFMQILFLDPNHGQARKALRATILRKFQDQGAPGKIKLFGLRGKFEAQIRTTKDPKKKSEICQKFLNEDPSNSKIRTILAESLNSQGFSEGGAVEGEFALESDPKNVTAAKVLTECLIKLKRPKEAQQILQKAQAVSKDDRDIEKLQRDLAAMLTMQAGFEEAKDYREVIKDKDGAARLEAQQHLIQNEDQLKAVISDLEEQLSQNPTDARIPKKIADLIFEKRKDYKEAQQWYRKASQLAPHDSVLRDKIDDCDIRVHDVQVERAAKANDPKLREYRAARLKFKIASFERRVKDRPTDMSLRFELGTSYYEAGPNFLDRAVAEFQQSVKDPRKKPDSHFYLGRSFQKKKLYDMADKQYEQAEEAVLAQGKKLMIAYNRALCCAEAGNFPKAIDLGKRIMEVDISYKDIATLLPEWQSKGG